jgi:hypothetical protein
MRYDQIGSEYKKESEHDCGSAAAEEGRLRPAGLPTREVYRSQQNLTGPKSTWNTRTEDFSPCHAVHARQRVMLYAHQEARAWWSSTTWC